MVRDWRAPIVEVFSPKPEITVLTRDVLLNFTVNEAASEIKYSLDGTANVTIAENMTIIGLTNGNHNFRIFATDLSGNEAASKTIHFTVNAPAVESVPIFTIVVAIVLSVAIAVTGLLLYRRKQRYPMQ
jgi:hypothetical protein